MANLDRDIHYLSCLPESQRYLGGAGIKESKLVTPSTRLGINAKYPEHPCHGIDWSEETNNRKTPCNVAMPTWTALRSPFFTCNHPMKFTAKYYHPISNRAHTSIKATSPREHVTGKLLTHLNPKATIHF